MGGELVRWVVLYVLPALDIVIGITFLLAAPRWERRHALFHRARRPIEFDDNAAGPIPLAYESAPVEVERPGATVPARTTVRAMYAAAAVFPWAALGLTALALLHARLTLGRWPVAGTDPATGLATAAASLALCGCPLVRLCLTVGTLYLLLERLRDRPIGLWLALHGLGSLAAAGVVRSTGFLDWATR